MDRIEFEDLMALKVCNLRVIAMNFTLDVSIEFFLSREKIAETQHRQ